MLLSDERKVLPLAQEMVFEVCIIYIYPFSKELPKNFNSIYAMLNLSMHGFLKWALDTIRPRF